MVYLCTTQYSSRYLNTYAAHNTPVYNIQWNTFIPNIFITCASERIIKIWDKDSKYVVSCYTIEQDGANLYFQQTSVYVRPQFPGQFNIFI